MPCCLFKVGVRVGWGYHNGFNAVVMSLPYMRAAGSKKARLIVKCKGRKRVGEVAGVWK